MSWKLLVTITAGTPYRFSTENLAVARAAQGDVLNFIGGVESPSIPTIGEDDSTAEITLPTSLLDPQALRAKGVRLAGAPCEVALWNPGTDWSKRVLLLVGRVHPLGERRLRNKFTITLAAFEQAVDPQFPPWIVTDDGFPGIPGGSVSKTMSVVYGNCNDVPLVPLLQPTPPLPQVRFLISGSPLSGTWITIRPDGDNGQSYKAQVYTDVHPQSGAVYSYVGLNGSAGASNYIADGVLGHVAADGRLINGLGDVVDHAIRNYGRMPADRVDEERLARFRARANRITVASIFGGAPGQTVVQTLKARYEQSFPVSISWRGGRIGADFLGFDQDDVPLRNLRLGAEILDRVDPVEVDGDIPYTDFFVEYDRNIVGGSFRSLIYADPSNSADCARAASRFGRVRYQTLQIPDLNDGQGARAVLDWLVDKFAVQRTKVTYLLTLDTMIHQPILSAFSITDANMRWASTKFRLQTLKPRLDGLCEATFLSYGECP